MDELRDADVMRRSELFRSVGETIDRLMSLEVRTRGFMTGVVPTLYEAARKKEGGPLAFSAAERLIAAVDDSEVVLIVTGHLYPELMPHGETDGPPGAAALARIIGEAFSAHPIVMCDEPVMGAMVGVLRAAGLLESTNWPQRPFRDHRATAIPIPTDEHSAQALAQRVFDEFRVGAIVTVEKISPNSEGVLHSGLGGDLSGILGRADALVLEAQRRNILSVGVGDVGNEIGFGRIRETVRDRVPYGATCRCECGQGIAAAIETDALLVAGTSNWGAYALEASIAALLGRPNLIHNGAMEKRMLAAAVAGGAVDGLSTALIPGADGLSDDFHAMWVELLRQSVEIGCDGEISSRVASEVGSHIPSMEDLVSEF